MRAGVTGGPRCRSLVRGRGKRRQAPEEAACRSLTSSEVLRTSE